MEKIIRILRVLIVTVGTQAIIVSCLMHNPFMAIGCSVVIISCILLTLNLK